MSKKSKIVPTGRVINIWEHSGWGNSIFFMDYKNRKLSGHLPNKPKVGDEIRSKMESGGIGRFIVNEVDYMRDPQDMFFCTVNDLGYLE